MSPEEISIDSDFREPYDIHFASKHAKNIKYILHRIAEGKGLGKAEQFSLLETNHFYVPPHGTVKEVLCQFPYEKLVVYLNPYAHRGEGKILKWSDESLEDYSDEYCSVYINQKSNYPTSYRDLWLGNKGFFLKYKSLTSGWQSNTGEVEIKIENTLTSRMPCNYPLFAIDFVEDITGKLWAIDFNTAPGIKHTPLYEAYKPREIAQFIADWVEKNESIR